MIPSTDNHLLQVHAYLECIWRPIRHRFKEGKTASRICMARKAGLKLPAFTSNQQAWKRSQRDRDALEARGLWQHGTLTPAGKLAVRSWVWLVDSAVLIEAVERIRECVRRNWCRRGGLVPETFIAGAEWGKDSTPFADTQIVLLPALIDGWIVSESTVEGHAFYKVSDGIDVDAAIAETMPAELDCRPDYVDAYLRHTQTLMRMIVSGSLKIETGGELGEIPLPVGMPLLDESKPYDAGDFGPLFPTPA